MGTPIEYKMPSPLEFDTVGDMFMKWRNFKQQLNVFIVAAGLDKVSEKRKSAILLNSIGLEGQNIYYNILKKSEEDTETPKYENLLKTFDEYFEPKQNEVINTYNFNNRNQEEGETFDAFYSALRKLVKNCNYKEAEDRMLRDRIVMGVRDKNLQRKLLETSKLSLQLAVERSRAAELSQEHANLIQKNEETLKVDAVRNQQFEAKYNNNYIKNNNIKRQTNYNTQFYQCKKCNTEHGPRQCPAYGKTCSKCHKMNHFAPGCKNRKVYSVDQEQIEVVDNSVHNL